MGGSNLFQLQISFLLNTHNKVLVGYDVEFDRALDSELLQIGIKAEDGSVFQWESMPRL